ncbi:MAG: hypothetical protein KDC44_24525, partial [Phaeodactylibacter sp.]|nr:hypothetical protein [Phaeodactylibacter sp.]
MPWKFILLLTFCLHTQALMAFFQIQTIPSDSQRVARWIELSKEAMPSNFSLAKTYGDSALALSQAMHFEWGLLRAHRQIATACYYGGELDTAIYHYRKQMAFYE